MLRNPPGDEQQQPQNPARGTGRGGADRGKCGHGIHQKEEKGNYPNRTPFHGFSSQVFTRRGPDLGVYHRERQSVNCVTRAGRAKKTFCFSAAYFVAGHKKMPFGGKTI